jgi:hypothetical protein
MTCATSEPESVVICSLTQWDCLTEVDLSVSSPEILLDLSLDVVSAIPVVDMREFPGLDIECS